MESKLRVSDHLFASVIRQRKFETLEELSGKFKGELWRNGRLIGKYSFNNGATDEGKEYLLGAGFNAITPISTWYLGLIDGTSGVPTLAASDTMAAHIGWDEFTLYDETTRQSWAKSFDSLTNRMISSAAAQYTIQASFTGTGYLAGGFLVSNNTKTGSTGLLWATGVYGSMVPVQALDIFKLNYITGL
jgi:hypothetical protein